MWMTLCPSASRAAAASITSMTMNGGTALRREVRRPSGAGRPRAIRGGRHGRTPHVPQALKPPWLHPTGRVRVLAARRARAPITAKWIGG